MILSIISFVAGVVLLHQFAVLPSELELVLSGTIAIASIFFRFWRLMFLILGFVWAGMLANERLKDRLPKSLEGQDFLIEGVASGLPQKNEGITRFDFEPDPSAKPRGDSIPSRIRISWYDPQSEIKAGQRWRMSVRMKRPHGTMNPGGFDYERWLLLEGIGATGYVRPAPKPVQLPANRRRDFISHLRQNISDQLEALLKGDENQGIIKALIIGQRNEITPEQWDVFQKTGTVHLVAISGLHIGLVAGLVYFIVLRLWAYIGILCLSPPVAAALSALGAAFFYAAMAGFSIPTLRALIMLAIVMTAVILQRNTGLFHTLALALFVIVLLDPFSVLSPGLWLSFAAVAVLFIGLSGRSQSNGYWFNLIKMNWVASIGLVPLLLFFFQRISLIAPLANLIAVPVISLVVVPLLLVSILWLQFLPEVGNLLFHAAGFILENLYAILQSLAGFPYSSLNSAPPNAWAMVLACLGVFMMLAPKGIPGRWTGVVMILPAFFPSNEKIAKAAFKLTVLDVGQGLSTVIQTESHVLVFDAGDQFSSGSDMGQRVVLPYLRNQGVEQIDLLLISHGDNDHIGGADSIIKTGNVKRILSSVPDELKPYEANDCRQGQFWVWDQVKFRMLSPPVPGFASENDNSCVLKIESEHGSALLTGDIERTAEEWLIDNYADALQADLLIAPHHGSETSSSRQFLEKVNPGLILIPAGYKNRFGHPSKKVLNRYRNEGVSWFNIAFEGAVEVTMDGDQIEVERFRKTNGRYWNDIVTEIR